MNILIKRYRKRPETIDGHLYIFGAKICDTAENATRALPEGEYQIHIHYCKQYKRKVLRLELSCKREQSQACLSYAECSRESSEAQPATREAIVTGDEVSGQWNGRPICLEDSTKCPLQKWVFYDTTLPTYCPQLKIGNGVYNRPDGSIIVGKYHVPGCVLHSKDAYDPLYQRIRKSIERGNQVVLTIKNEFV